MRQILGHQTSDAVHNVQSLSLDDMHYDNPGTQRVHGPGHIMVCHGIQLLDRKKRETAQKELWQCPEVE